MSDKERSYSMRLPLSRFERKLLNKLADTHYLTATDMLRFLIRNQSYEIGIYPRRGRWEFIETEPHSPSIPEAVTEGGRAA